jgi:DNA-binding PadR family transcriptional regulator
MTPLLPLPGALLGLLHQAPASGYDLRRQFATTPIRAFSDSPGAIYPALKRLRQQGLIAGTVERRAGLRQREVFRLTPAGKAALAAWLAAPPTAGEVERDTGPLLLRFVFIPDVLGTPAALRFLDTLEGLLAAHLTDLEHYLRDHRQGMPLAARLGFEHGLETFRSHRQWCQRAARALRRSAAT